MAVEVTVMSLSAREELALSSLEDGLARADPKLASLLAMFSRLTSGEQMPAREKILTSCRRNPRRGLRYSCPRSVCLRARLLRLHPGFLQMALPWLAAVMAVALVAVALAVGRSNSGQACTSSWSATCVARVSVPSPRAALHRPTSGQATHPGRQVPSAADRSAATRRKG